MRYIAGVSTVTSLANWNGQMDRQTDGRTDTQDHVLSKADALTKRLRKLQHLGATQWGWLGGCG